MKVKSLKFILIFLTLFEIISSKKISCPKNYTFVSKNERYCEQKCDNLKKFKCRKLSKLESPCKCIGNYALNNKKKCVLKKDCPNKQHKKCPKNMKYNHCITKSPKTCFKEIKRKYYKKCKPGCECKKGYVLNNKNKCILKSKCPKMTTTSTRKPNTPKCPENMIYSKFPKNYSKSCFKNNYIKNNYKKSRKTNKCKKPKCICKENYVLHGNRCISLYECNKLKAQRPKL